MLKKEKMLWEQTAKTFNARNLDGNKCDLKGNHGWKRNEFLSILRDYSWYSVDDPAVSIIRYSKQISNFMLKAGFGIKVQVNKYLLNWSEG